MKSTPTIEARSEAEIALARANAQYAAARDMNAPGRSWFVEEVARALTAVVILKKNTGTRLM